MRKLKAVFIILLFGLIFLHNVKAEAHNKIVPQNANITSKNLEAGSTLDAEVSDAQENNILDKLPSVEKSEVESNGNPSEFPDTEPRDVSKTVGAWFLITVAIFSCLSIISNNLEIPYDYDANFKSKRLLHVRSKRTKYKL